MNFYYSSNPSNLQDALWKLLESDIDCLSDCIIFLPTLRAIKTYEKFIVDKIGSSCVLPKFMVLGQESDSNNNLEADSISDLEQTIILSIFLKRIPSIGTFSFSLPISKEIISIKNNLESENIDISHLDWLNLIGKDYSKFFQIKAKYINYTSRVLKDIIQNKITQQKKRNLNILLSKDILDRYKKVYVCGVVPSNAFEFDLIKYIAEKNNSYIILPGKISGSEEDLELETNPYYLEYKLLKDLNISISSLQEIELNEESNIDYLNLAFRNSFINIDKRPKKKLIEFDKQSDEVSYITEVTKKAVKENKSVLIVVPNNSIIERLKQSFINNSIDANFSVKESCEFSFFGRSILNLLDSFIEKNKNDFLLEYNLSNKNLYLTILSLIDKNFDKLEPGFDYNKPEIPKILRELKNISSIFSKYKIYLKDCDARLIISYLLSNIYINEQFIERKVSVLSSLESRMQKADTVVISSLNEKEFPSVSKDYWLPKNILKKIGILTEKSISISSLDFINLSCTPNVYWLRSKVSDSVKTIESRFLSRANLIYEETQKNITDNDFYLKKVLDKNNIKYLPLVKTVAAPLSDKSNVFVTDLDFLVHNPYAFYVKHILKLKYKEDYFENQSYKDFGILVHSILEDYVKNPNINVLEIFRKSAKDVLNKYELSENNIIFQFWNKRFENIVQKIPDLLDDKIGAATEIKGKVIISGRTVEARADIVLSDRVVDIKTGEVPSQKSLENGNSPQLPIEAFILQNSGFPIKYNSSDICPIIEFLQLKNKKIGPVLYRGEVAYKFIKASIEKVKELFAIYSKDFTEYEYFITSDRRYKIYDDLYRLEN